MKRANRAIRLTKGESISFERLDDLLDVSVEKWDRQIRRLTREFRTKSVQLDVPATRFLGAGNGVSWTNLFESQVKHLPAMERPEEFRMARRYEFAKALVRDALLAVGYPEEQVDELVLRPVLALPRLKKAADPESWAMLGERIDELERVRNVYVEGALYLTLGPVRKYRGLGVDEPDLVQESAASLFQAIEGFDWRRDVRFKTYALYWVQQAILKTLYNASRTVRVPVWVQKAYRKIRKAQDAARLADGTLPDHTVVAANLDLPVERIEEILAVKRRAISLDAPKGDDDLTIGASIADEATPIPDSIVEGDLSQQLALAMEELPEREKAILERRFGLGGGEPETLGDIAQDFGVTAERIRQLQNAAIARLKKPGHVEHLKLFV